MSYAARCHPDISGDSSSPDVQPEIFIPTHIFDATMVRRIISGRALRVSLCCRYATLRHFADARSCAHYAAAATAP